MKVAQDAVSFFSPIWKNKTENSDEQNARRKTRRRPTSTHTFSGPISVKPLHNNNRVFVYKYIHFFFYFLFCSVLNQSNNWDPQFDFTYRGPVTMKGKPEPMKVWILTRKRNDVWTEASRRPTNNVWIVDCLLIASYRFDCRSGKTCLWKLKDYWK